MWKDDFFQFLRDSTLQNPQIDRAMALKHENLPKRIYKYRTDNEHSRESLKSDTIWLASPDSYNDPYDCFLRFSSPAMTAAFERGLIDPFLAVYQLQIPRDKIAEAKQSANPIQTLSEQIEAVGTPGMNPRQMAEFIMRVIPPYVESTVGVLQALRSVMKICSFSTVHDSILMWSHYSAHHQGFCIEYDLSQFDPADAFLKNLYPIIYSTELFDLTPWAEKMVMGNREEFTPVFPLLGVLQKFEGWAYEQEWRYVFVQETPGANRARPLLKPSRVLLGAKISDLSKKQIMEICATKGIPVYQMHMAYNKYELEATLT